VGRSALCGRGGPTPGAHLRAVGVRVTSLRVTRKAVWPRAAVVSGYNWPPSCDTAPPVPATRDVCRGARPVSPVRGGARHRRSSRARTPPARRQRAGPGVRTARPRFTNPKRSFVLVDDGPNPSSNDRSGHHRPPAAVKPSPVRFSDSVRCFRPTPGDPPTAVGGRFPGLRSRRRKTVLPRAGIASHGSMPTGFRRFWALHNRWRAYRTCTRFKIRQPGSPTNALARTACTKSLGLRVQNHRNPNANPPTPEHKSEWDGRIKSTFRGKSGFGDRSAKRWTSFVTQTGCATAWCFLSSARWRVSRATALGPVERIRRA